MKQFFSSIMGLAMCLVLLSACTVPPAQPTSFPTSSSQISEEPSETPSEAPSQEPSEEPSQAPSESPAPTPSPAPSRNPSPSPSQEPSTPPSEQPSQPQPAMSLNRTELVFTTQGGTFQLEVSLTGTDGTSGVVWTSSDSGVAAVDNTGLVTAIAPGTATITAQSGDGLAASCIVRCRWEDPSQPPVRVDLSAFADRILSQYAFSAQGPAEDDSIDQHLPGLTSVSAQQCLVYLCQEPKNSEELILIEVTNAGDLEAVKSILQARINTMVSGGAWFPDAVEAWTHNSRVVSNGNYVMLVVHPQCDAIAEVFHALF